MREHIVVAQERLFAKTDDVAQAGHDKFEVLCPVALDIFEHLKRMVFHLIAAGNEIIGFIKHEQQIWNGWTAFIQPFPDGAAQLVPVAIVIFLCQDALIIERLGDLAGRFLKMQSFEIDDDGTIAVLVAVDTVFGHLQQCALAQLAAAINKIRARRRDDPVQFFLAADEHLRRDDVCRFFDVRLAVRKRHDERHEHAVHRSIGIMRAQVCDHDPVDHRKDAFAVLFLELAGQLTALGKLQSAIKHDEHRYWQLPMASNVSIKRSVSLLPSR